MSHAPTIDQDELARRRLALAEAIGDDAVAIFAPAPERRRSHDTFYPYRASSDVLYLTGFPEPDAVVVLAPGHPDGDLHMFVRERDPLKEQWDGRRAGAEGARDHYRADAAYTLDQLDSILPKLIDGRTHLHYTFGQDDAFDKRVLALNSSLRHRRNLPPGAPAAVVDARDALHELRLIKSEAELAVMRHAAEITSEAHTLAMRACSPGMHEYELQALVEFHFRRRGASFPAYSSIVGSGDNATILHYIENDGPIADGDVVLIDAGCEFGGYAADITRSFPASGSFTPAQRDLYQAVLETQIAAISDVTVGTPFQELHARTERRLAEACVQLGLLSGDLDDLIESKAHKKYYPHGVGHWLGIDVHDVGPYYSPDGARRALAPGMVLTIEPGLYVPASDDSAPAGLRGLGVRIEDDVLVTAEGPQNLTSSCPKAVAEIEALVGSGVPLP